MRDITDLGGDNAGGGGTVDEGEVDAGHPGEPGFLDTGDGGTINGEIIDKSHPGGGRTTRSP